MKLSQLLAISFLPLSGWEKLSLVQNNPACIKIQHQYPTLDINRRVKRFLAFLAEGKYHVVFLGMKGYPSLLAQMDNPPFRLCCKGSFPSPDEQLLSLCGTRHPDLNAGQASYAFALEAGANGVGIVTSHSSGIDRAALYACRDACFKAYVCCDCGLLSARIKNNELLDGLNLISPFEPTDEALRNRCLSRNVLTAALSPILVVMQAPEKSGALHCAGIALDLGKDVYVHATGIRRKRVNQGTLRLHQEGALVIDGYEELAKEIGYPRGKTLRETGDAHALYRYGNTWYSFNYGDQ